jgi:hypothetical protein
MIANRTYASLVSATSTVSASTVNSAPVVSSVKVSPFSTVSQEELDFEYSEFQNLLAQDKAVEEAKKESKGRLLTVEQKAFEARGARREGPHKPSPLTAKGKESKKGKKKLAQTQLANQTVTVVDPITGVESSGSLNSSLGRRAKRKQADLKVIRKILPKQSNIVPQIELDSIAEGEIKEELKEGEILVEEEEEPFVMPLRETIQIEVVEKPAKKAKLEPKIEDKSGWSVVKAVKKPTKPSDRVAKFSNFNQSSIPRNQFRPNFNLEETKSTPNPLLPPKPKTGKVMFCQAIIRGIKCKFGDKCKFAHSVKEMDKTECRFPFKCRFVQYQGKGTYTSTCPSERVCMYWHAKESEESFCKRMGLKSVM